MTSTRRRFLAGLVSLGSAGLAGCIAVPVGPSPSPQSRSGGGSRPPPPTIDEPENATPIDPSDSATDVLENAAAGDAYRLADGTHQATRPITITTDGVTLVIPESTSLRAPDGVSEGESFLSIHANNVTIMGNGTIEGNVQNSNGLAADPPSSHGHEHIVHVGHHSIDWISGFVLDGLSLRNAPGGDGIYINQADGVRCQNFVVDSAYRNGISCTDARNVAINNFLTRNTDGAAPKSGLAFEQNSPGEVIENVTISNGETRGNASHGLYVNNHYTEQEQGASTVTIQIRNVTAIGNGLQGFSLHGTSGAEQISLTGCRATENARAGYYVGGDGNVEITNCEAIANGQNRDGNNHEVGIALDEDEGNGTPADVVVQNFIARDQNGTQKYPGTALKGSTLRVVGATVGSHTHQDGFRAHGPGSRVAYRKVVVESGGAPAFATGGGSIAELSESGGGEGGGGKGRGGSS